MIAPIIADLCLILTLVVGLLPAGGGLVLSFRGGDDRPDAWISLTMFGMFCAATCVGLLSLRQVALGVAP